MSQQRKASLWVFMMTVSLVASSSSAQETQGNPQPPSRREGLGGKRPQQQRGRTEGVGKGTNDISAPEEYWAFFDAILVMI